MILETKEVERDVHVTCLQFDSGCSKETQRLTTKKERHQQVANMLGETFMYTLYDFVRHSTVPGTNL